MGEASRFIVRTLKQPREEVYPARNEVSFQQPAPASQPCKCTIFEADLPAPVEPTDDSRPGIRFDSYLPKDPELEPRS